MRGTWNNINLRRTTGPEQFWNHILKPTQEYVREINLTDKADASVKKA